MRTTSFYLWLTIYLGILLFVSPANAQDHKASSKTKKEAKAYKKYQIAIAPSKVISFWSPTLELSFEHKLKNPSHAFLYEVGFISVVPTPYTENHSVPRRLTRTRQKARGFKIKPAYRFYIRNNVEHSKKMYISANYLFKYVDRYRLDYNNYTNYRTAFNKIIITNGLLFNIGFKKEARRSPISVEIEGGVGLATKNVSYKNIPDNISSLAVYDFYTDPWFVEKEGNSIHSLSNFTVRIGYRF